MRIAFVVNNYPPRLGGLENHVGSLASHLRALGHEVFVYTLARSKESVVENGIHVLRMREYFQVGSVLGIPAIGTRRMLLKRLRVDKIDLVSVHTRFFPLTWLGISAARRTGIPVLHTEHGSGFVVSESRIISFASRLIDLTLGRASLRAADGVLGVSEAVLEFVERLSGVRGDLFYNAIEVSSGAQPATLRPRHFVFVGRLVPGKGWDVFVEVLQRLIANGHTVTAEILGDGPDMPAVRKKVEHIKESIRVRGRVEPSEVRLALSGATLVNATTLAEGFQTTLLEAIAEKGAVVTFEVPGARTLVAEGAPVRITLERTADSLYDELIAFLEDPPPPAPDFFIDSWAWPERSRQFVSVCERLLNREESRS